jgi:hypothetical protein
MLQWLYTYIASVCSKCFTYFRRMLQVFYLNVTVVIHTCCKCMFQLFHLVLVRCSRCCSPRALTRGHACAARTHRVLPISIMQASSNSRTCTQQAVSVQMTEHSLVKVHARMQSAKAGQYLTEQRPGDPAPPGWSPMVDHAAGVNTGVVVLPPSLSHAVGRAQAHALLCRRNSSTRGPSSSRRGA